MKMEKWLFIQHLEEARLDIVILGAGIGGMPMAYELKPLLRPGDRITVVSNTGTFHFVPSNPLGCGQLAPAAVPSNWSWRRIWNGAALRSMVAARRACIPSAIRSN